MQKQLLGILIQTKGTLKYRWFALLLAAPICLLGWAIVMALPNKYTSVAKVHIDSTTMLQPLLKGIAIQQDTRMLIRVMKKLMFTRPNLEKIIELSNLDFAVETELQRIELYTAMRKSIKITGGKHDGIFKFEYASVNPDMAKNVVTAVLTVFSEQTQKSSLEDVSSSQRFIEQQIRSYENRLRNAERAREAFKRANFGLLPGEGGGQLNRLQNNHDQLEKAKLSLSEAISKRNVLKSHMQEVINSGDSWATPSNVPLVLSTEDQQIQSLRLRRMDLLLKYTDKHPYVRAIDVTLAGAIQHKVHRKKEKVLSGLPNAEALANPYVQQLKTELDKSEANVASLNTRVQLLQQRIENYKEQLNSRLTVETEMLNLNRDYDTINTNYRKLVQRREQVSISEKVDNETVAIKFKIADPPNKPLSPSGPKRLLLLTVVLILGLAAGFGLAFALYYVRPTYMATPQLAEMSGLTVLGSISRQKIGSVKKVKMFIYILLFLALLSIYAGLIGFEYIKSQGTDPIQLIKDFF